MAKPEMGYVFRDGGTTPPLRPEGDTPKYALCQQDKKASKPITATSAAPLGQGTSTNYESAVGRWRP